MSYTNPQPLVMRVGEKAPLYGEISPASGTATITEATFTLQDDTGTNLLDAVAAQIANDGEVAYYDLDSSTLPASAWYYAFFELTVSASDSIDRTILPVLSVYVAPIQEGTYIPGTPIGRVRGIIGDTNVTDLIWSDVEIRAALSDYSNPDIAAAQLLTGAASDAARLAIITRNDTTTDASKLAATLLAQAAALRGNAIVPIITANRGGCAPLFSVDMKW